MEDKVYTSKDSMDGFDAENIPVILALPAINAPSNRPQARAPFRKNTGIQQTGFPDKGQEQTWDEEHLMPLVNIISTMRTVLPADAGVPSDVASIVQRAMSDFMLLVTSQAREHCKQEARRIIKGDDIIWALGKLGFASYVRPLELYFSQYQEHLKAGTPHGNSEASSSMAAQSSSPQKDQEQFFEASTSQGSPK